MRGDYTFVDREEDALAHLVHGGRRTEKTAAGMNAVYEPKQTQDNQEKDFCKQAIYWIHLRDPLLAANTSSYI